MERTIGLRPAKEFSEPKTYPQYQPFRRGPLALSYDPYYVAPTTSTETTTTDTTATDTSAKDQSATNGTTPTPPAAATTKTPARP
jgi:hypothetical protein